MNPKRYAAPVNQNNTNSGGGNGFFDNVEDTLNPYRKKR